MNELRKGYSEVDELLGSSSSLKVGNNTYLTRVVRGIIALRLHDTEVVKWYSWSDKRLDFIRMLNSGGWRTVTTKDRINKCLPTGMSLYSKDWEWKIRDKSGKVFEFHENIVIGPLGKVRPRWQTSYFLATPLRLIADSSSSHDSLR